MAKIGVEAKINLLDSTAYVDRVLVKHDFDMTVTSFANLRDINQRSVSFFKGQQSDYVGIDDPRLEEMVRQWRRTLDAAEQRKISADIQRVIADQLYWVNVTGYPFFQAYRAQVKNYPFYIAALVKFGTTWLEKQQLVTGADTLSAPCLYSVSDERRTTCKDAGLCFSAFSSP